MSTFDRDYVSAQSLGGLSIEGELARVRSTHEAGPRRARNDFQEARAETQAALNGLEATKATFVPEALTFDDVLGAAAVELRARAAEFHRKAQAEEAFRLRHGLARSAAEPKTLEAGIILTLMALLETAANTGFLLGAGLSASVVSAISFSLMVSTANVLINVLAGFHLGRWKTYGLHASDADSPELATIRRRAQWLFGAYLAVMGISLTELALVRTQKSLDSLQVSLGALFEILLTPDALYLLFTNGAVAVLSYFKGLSSFADPYPYFSRFHNATVTSYEAFQSDYLAFTAEIETRHTQARHSLDHDWKSYRKHQDGVHKVFERCLESRRELFRTVDEAESTLKTDLARLAETHRAARGDSQPLPEAGLNQLASYQNFLEDSEPPALDVPPNIHDYRSALDETKASALYELRSLFENLHATYGDRSS